MSHNLNFNPRTGQHSFFSVQEKAWHGLGQLVDAYPTSAEAMSFAGLDFNVEKHPLYVQVPPDSGGQAKADSPETRIPGYFATVRTDTGRVFGIVGKDYQIVQNRDAFSFFDAIVGGGDGILYETAGALGNGERIFITAKLPGYIRVGNGDDITEKYLFLTTSHDGSGSITAAFTPIRVVCQNTLNAALRTCSNVIRIRHTSGAKQRLENAHRVMGLCDNLTHQLEGIFNRWAAVPMSDKETRELIQYALCPNLETFQALKAGNGEALSAMFVRSVDDACQYAQTAESQQMRTARGTVFGAYNAVTGYFQNLYPFKDPESKVRALLLGGAAQAKTQKAFGLCEAFVKDKRG